jgi:N4-gp56 family major capsid protein
MKQIRDILFSTLNVNPYANGEYVMLAATKACRGLKDDPDFIDWHKYVGPEQMLKGEVGKIENIRVVECNNTSFLSGSKGTGSVLGEAVAFGDDAIAMAEVRAPELRAKESEDYGRSKGVAWYGIYGFDQIWKDSATAGECRVVHVTSS